MTQNTAETAAVCQLQRAVTAKIAQMLGYLPVRSKHACMLTCFSGEAFQG